MRLKNLATLFAVYNENTPTVSTVTSLNATQFGLDSNSEEYLYAVQTRRFNYYM